MTRPANHPTNDARRFLTFLAGPALAAAISFGATFLIARVAPPEAFGKASLFVLGVNVFLVVALGGTDQAYSRFFYEARRTGSERALRARTIALSLLFPLALVPVLLVWGEPLAAGVFGAPMPELVPIFWVTLVLGTLGRFGYMTLRLRGHAGATSAVTVGRALLYAGGVLLLATTLESKVHAVVLAFSGSIVGGALLAWSLVGRGEAARRPEPSAGAIAPPPTWGEIVRFGAPLVPAALAMWLIESTDRLALRVWGNFADLGIFATAFRLVGPLTVLRQGFATYWMPASLRAFDAEPMGESAGRRRAFDLVLAFGAPLAAAAALVMPLLVAGFDPAYDGARAVMPALVFVPYFYMLSEVTVMGVIFRKRTQDQLWVMLATLAANVGLNAILVPRAGAVGAAIATALAFLIFFLLRTWVGERALGVGPSWGRWGAGTLLVAGAVAAAMLRPDLGLVERAGSLVIVGAVSGALFHRQWRQAVSDLRGRAG